MTVSCTSGTKYGTCIGAFEDEDPKLIYAASVKNIVLAVIFSETIIVPAVVIISKTACPVGKR